MQHPFRSVTLLCRPQEARVPLSVRPLHESWRNLVANNCDAHDPFLPQQCGGTGPRPLDGWIPLPRSGQTARRAPPHAHHQPEHRIPLLPRRGRVRRQVLGDSPLAQPATRGTWAYGRRACSDPGSLGPFCLCRCAHADSLMGTLSSRGLLRSCERRVGRDDRHDIPISGALDRHAASYEDFVLVARQRMAVPGARSAPERYCQTRRGDSAQQQKEDRRQGIRRSAEARDKSPPASWYARRAFLSAAGTSRSRHPSHQSPASTRSGDTRRLAREEQSWAMNMFGSCTAVPMRSTGELRRCALNSERRNGAGSSCQRSPETAYYGELTVIRVMGSRAIW